MTIKIPVARVLALLSQLIKAIPGGITKEEAQALGESLVGLGMEILGQVVPGEIVIPVRK